MSEGEYQESQGFHDFEFFCEEHNYGWNTNSDGTVTGCIHCNEE